jgi:protein-S-isoprenylcysteine O-methyltransferase Ste14
VKLSSIGAAGAVAFGALTVLTLLVPDWIEVVFGVEPDGGSGAAEWLIVTGLGLVTLILAALSVRAWRHSRAVLEAEASAPAERR